MKRTTDAPSGAVTATTTDVPTTPVTRVRNLVVELTRPGRGNRTQQVLKGIDLDIAPGEILGLVGQSGSGKSILGLTLMGLLPERSRPLCTGIAEVCGIDVLAADHATMRRLRRERIGVVFQDPMTSLNPTMTIGEQIVEACSSEAVAIELLERVGVPNAASRMRVYPHQLSGGLRQRVMIAIAIAGKPALIVADEPTTALDVTVQRRVLELLAFLRDELECSILLVTHDLGVAGEIADNIAVMRAGEIVEHGTAAQLLTAPAHGYTQRLIASRITLDSDPHRPLPTFDPNGDLDAEPEPVTESEVYPAWSPDPDTAPALELTAVRKTFQLRRARPLTALDIRDVEIGVGESVAIVGESGSGKSTLLRIIAGLEKADDGSRMTSSLSGRPQMVFQDAGASLTPWMKVGELLVERLARERVPARDRRARAEHALALVGLDPSLLGVRTRELSGGQRQRVALARASIVPPSILLCDEPTSALDAWMAVNVINLLRSIRHQFGMSMLFVTHDLSVARLIGDRIIVMEHGRIVEAGPAAEVIANPREEYTKQLIAAVPDPRFEAS